MWILNEISLWNIKKTIYNNSNWLKALTPYSAIHFSVIGYFNKFNIHLLYLLSLFSIKMPMLV